MKHSRLTFIKLIPGLTLLAVLCPLRINADPVSQSSDVAMPSCTPGEHGMKMAMDDVALRNIKAPREENDRMSGDEHIKTLVFKNFVIDKIYPSMRGPWSAQNIYLNPGPNGRYAWITSYRGETVDRTTGAAFPEFMCHTDLGLSGAHGFTSQLGTSQGQTDIQFPQGFGFREESHPQDSLEIIGMVLNSNKNKIGQTLDFQFTIHYLEDKIAQAQNLKPLVLTAAVTRCTTAGKVSAQEFACEPATANGAWKDADQVSHTVHWLIPPGRHVYTTDVTTALRKPYDTTIHYIRMHVHPYGESLELRDATTHQTVWKGLAKNPEDPQDARVISTDIYSSTQGLPLLKDHRYELTAIYNNRTDHPIDAMAALWMYTLDKN